MTASQVPDNTIAAAMDAYNAAIADSKPEKTAMAEAIAAAVNAQPGLGGPPPTDPV